MSTLIVDRRGADIDAEGDTVVVRADGERKGTVPLKPLERVVVKGSARLSTRLLTKLAQSGIGLLILGGRARKPTAALIGQPSTDSTLRLAQGKLLAEESVRAEVSRALVRVKVEGQLDILRQLESRRGRSVELDRGITAIAHALDELARSGTSRARLRGIEGAAAAAYFAAVASALPSSLAFSGRNRRPPRDPVNACLSLGYTLLHFEAVREIASVGLDPMVGIYHDLAPGRHSLASDLAEPFRPAVDGLVLQAFSDRRLRPEHFSSSDGGCLLGKAGRREFYRAYEERAVRFRPALARLARDTAELVRNCGEGRPVGALEVHRESGEDDVETANLDHRL
jgi:CRISPR-associated protein Cas1